MTTQMSRRVGLDGVRGIAIALVLFHHGLQGTTATNAIEQALRYAAVTCWIGVDLFFVLSGFLITGILLRTRDSATYFRTFYMRRFLRIFPLYYFYIALLAVAGFVWPVLWPKLQLAWNAAYLSNVCFALNGTQWAPVAHLWSLAVEEQFYIVWPVAVYLLPRRWTAPLLVTAFVAFVTLRTLGAHLFHWPAVMTYAVLHFDGLLAGGALAALLHRRTPTRGARVAAWSALAVGACWVGALFIAQRGFDWADWSGALTVRYALLALTCAALVAVSELGASTGRLNRMLSVPPLVTLGKYSYAMYLLHYGFDWLLRTYVWHPQRVSEALLYVAVHGTLTLLLALCTWRLLEEPMVRLKDRYFAY